MCVVMADLYAGPDSNSVTRMPITAVLSRSSAAYRAARYMSVEIVSTAAELNKLHNESTTNRSSGVRALPSTGV